MSEVFIIADIGINANGNLNYAMPLIKSVIRSGTNAIKFQLWGNEYLAKCEWRNQLYGQRFNRLNLNMLKGYTLEYSKIYNRNVEWFCTAFDMESFNAIKDIGVNIYKIPSNRYVWGNKKLLKDIIRTAKIEQKRLIISCGNLNDYQVKRLKQKIMIATYSGSKFYKDIRYLYCVSKYPSKVKEIDLNKIGPPYLDNYLGYLYDGISDHSSLIEIPIAAVARGAKIIEVHVTLNKNMIGSDHKASLDVNEFEVMVKMIRNIEKTIL